ncbi:hypothetical protein IWW39_003259 [Coemansia spiralis]|uniref:Uncharacterized protein n=1 Tax=Coemansia spiralis TaxID=417178 RepID=A0A9W8L4G8_9FUNG|nr:hypothetical protein IWW39_003259 [Coemansia spiralis]
MRLFAQKGTSPIKHWKPAPESSRSRSSSVVVGVSLARQPHTHGSGPSHPLAEAFLSGTNSSCTLAPPVALQARVADDAEPSVLELLPVSDTHETEEAHFLESATAILGCDESGARLSEQDIRCGVVDLSCRDFVCVLPQIALFASSVTSLNLSRNALTSLPDEIGYLVCLQRIDVSQNRLESLPATLAYCQGLLTIDATQNRLTGLPSSMRHCGLLREVVLADNMLESVPSCLWSLASLKKLNLANNRIRALPARMFMPGGIAATNKPPTLDLDLQGCPVGQGLTDHVPLPPFVLSARFKYGVVAVDANQQDMLSESQATAAGSRRGIPTLVDTILCKLASSNVDYPYDLPDHLRERLDSLMVCDHCHALYPADMGVKRWRLIHRQDSVWPVEYDFCQEHWNDEKQRIASLFAPRKLESAQSYSEPRRAARAQAQLELSQARQAPCRKPTSSLALLASKLSPSALANKPVALENRHSLSLLERFSPKYRSNRSEASLRLSEIGRSASHRSSFLGLRLPSLAASSSSPDALEPEPDTVWQYYEGHVPRLPALPHF